MNFFQSIPIKSLLAQRRKVFQNQEIQMFFGNRYMGACHFPRSILLAVGRWLCKPPTELRSSMPSFAH